MLENGFAWNIDWDREFNPESRNWGILEGKRGKEKKKRERRRKRKERKEREGKTDSKIGDGFSEPKKNMCRRGVDIIAGEIFQPSLSPAGQVVLERAKKERGVSTPLRLRMPLVHKSRSRGRSVRVILGGLKVSGEKEATRTA